jgi:hypothetical protein
MVTRNVVTGFPDVYTLHHKCAKGDYSKKLIDYNRSADMVSSIPRNTAPEAAEAPEMINTYKTMSALNRFDHKRRAAKYAHYREIDEKYYDELVYNGRPLPYNMARYGKGVYGRYGKPSKCWLSIQRPRVAMQL